MENCQWQYPDYTFIHVYSTTLLRLLVRCILAFSDHLISKAPPILKKHKSSVLSLKLECCAGVCDSSLSQQVVLFMSCYPVTALQCIILPARIHFHC